MSRREWRLYADDKAAKNVPDDIIARATEVDWRKVRGLRDVIAHGYFGLDPRVVWDVATTKVDVLGAAVQRLLDDAT